jgi:hypothetical protein
MGRCGTGPELLDQVQRPEYRAWCGSGQPVPAEHPGWAAGSLGDRLCSGTHLATARNAPGLLTATVPDPLVIIRDPAQWQVAANVLVRAVVFDGLRVDHPAVSSVLDVPKFPEMDGPVFLIGACALGDATEVVVGDDPLSEVLAVLSPALDGAVPGLEGRAVADVLTGGRVTPYLCQLPDYVLKRMGRSFSVGGALRELADARVVPPAGILRVGLTILSVLADLCQSDSPSILRRAA